MKNLLYIFLILLLFQACVYEKMEPVIPKLSLSGLADSAIVKPESANKYIANTGANWSVLEVNGGSIDTSGNYISSKNEGVFTIIAINKLNISDTLKRKIIILNRAEIFNQMKKGGYILSFRHAAASLGSDQTASKVADWWKSCESTLARQITLPIGKNQSDSTGKVIKFLKIPIDTTLTSEFCRCRQTTEYFNLGVPNKTVKELTFSVYDEGNRYENTMKLFANRPIGTKNYIAVGHAGYSKTPTIAPLATLEWGDCAVFQQVSLGTEPKYIQTIKVKEWVALSKVLK